jgi:hypothetical protein
VFAVVVFVAWRAKRRSRRRAAAASVDANGIKDSNNGVGGVGADGDGDGDGMNVREFDPLGAYIKGENPDFVLFEFDMFIVRLYGSRVFVRNASNRLFVLLRIDASQGGGKVIAVPKPTVALLPTIDCKRIHTPSVHGLTFHLRSR